MATAREDHRARNVLGIFFEVLFEQWDTYFSKSSADHSSPVADDDSGRADAGAL